MEHPEHAKTERFSFNHVAAYKYNYELKDQVRVEARKKIIPEAMLAVKFSSSVVRVFISNRNEGNDRGKCLGLSARPGSNAVLHMSRIEKGTQRLFSLECF